MQRNRTKDGVHVGRADESNKYTAEELALMKTQDVKYVALKASEEAKKAAKLKANLHRVGLDADEEPVSEEDEERYDDEGFAIRAAPRQKRKHTVFVDDAEAARAFAAEGSRKTKRGAGDDAAATDESDAARDRKRATAAAARAGRSASPHARGGGGGERGGRHHGRGHRAGPANGEAPGEKTRRVRLAAGARERAARLQTMAAEMALRREISHA